MPPVSIVSAMGVALVGVYGSYDGWYQAVFSAGEIRRPDRDLPRGIIGGTLVMVAAYTLINLVYSEPCPSM